ncbi:MAG: GNAT family N-acetyltransferase [Candidatus Delongbacteria bacterium]|nr:GNAT family N-acetyltransferase [Candidatus Delongbacteria bacterium]
MKEHIIKKLDKTNLKEFRFIAETHEDMPRGWISDYTPDENEIINTENRLIELHKTLDIFCMVAEVDGSIVSFIWAEINKQNVKVIDIMSLWTDKDYRNKGIATQLKNELEIWCKTSTKAYKIRTTISSKNQSMILLNEKLGYRTDYYKMSKKLN